MQARNRVNTFTTRVALGLAALCPELEESLNHDTMWGFDIRQSGLYSTVFDEGIRDPAE